MISEKESECACAMSKFNKRNRKPTKIAIMYHIYVGIISIIFDLIINFFFSESI